MRTKGVRIYGVKDLRLEEFELPPMQKNVKSVELCQII